MPSYEALVLHWPLRASVMALVAFQGFLGIELGDFGEIFGSGELFRLWTFHLWSFRQQDCQDL